MSHGDKVEWVAASVREPSIPRGWVAPAREAVAGDRAPSELGGRFWELSGP